MAGRESRARLLAPSFLVIATAIACGQTEDANDIATNPPWPGTGGDGGSAGTGPVTAGVGANPPVFMGCPAVQPTTGASCSGYQLNAQSCDYPGPPGGCGFPQYTVTASCVGGAWEEKTHGFSSCNPPMPVSCPIELPMAGQPCGGGFSVYPECNYATPSCAKVNAECFQGMWQLEMSGCVPPSEGGAGGGGNEGGTYFEPIAGASNDSAGASNEPAYGGAAP